MPYSPTHPTLEAALLRYGGWLEARGVSKRARICFVSRLRRYLRWFQARYHVLPLPSVVSGQAVYLYREDLYRRGLSAYYVRSLVYPARTYHQWAVETHQINEPPLPAMSRPPAARKMKSPRPPSFSVPYVGREEYLDWAARQGIGPRTLRHYRGTLSSLARWMRDSQGEVLGPQHLSPDILRRYFRATDRSPTSLDSASFALRSYAAWAVEAGLLAKDPYAASRRTHSVDPAERKAFGAWLAVNGCASTTVSSRLSALSTFGRWFLATRRRKLSRRVVRPADLAAYREWLAASPRKLSGHGSLAPSTVESLQRTADRYLQWASL